MDTTYKIYCLENTITGEKYIGQTKKKYLCYRRTEIMARAHNPKYRGYNCPLFTAIREYGRDAFTITLLEEVGTRLEANNREHHYIVKYNTQAKGYNVLNGGYKTADMATPDFCERIKEGLRKAGYG